MAGRGVPHEMGGRRKPEVRLRPHAASGFAPIPSQEHKNGLVASAITSAAALGFHERRREQAEWVVQNDQRPPADCGGPFWSCWLRE